MNTSDWEIVLNEISEAKAQLFLAKLQQAGLSPFMTNGAMATMLPIQDSAYIIRVPEDQLFEAREIIHKLQIDLGDRSKQEFSHADIDDIAYEKSVTEYEDRIYKSKSIQLWLVLLGVMVLIILSYLLR